MSTTLTNGLKLPDKGSVDWYADMQNNYTILDGAVGTVAEHTSQIAGKAPLVHTHTKADITDLLNSNFIPSANNSYDLGSSSYQWSNLYAKNYYYNGTAWGLDKDNVWTGANSFTSVIQQRINSVYSQIPTTDRFAVHEFVGTDSNRIFTVNCADRSSGQREMSLMVYDTDGTFQASGLFKESDNSFSFRPRKNNNTINLGNSTAKWKTINGINPGALSLPKIVAKASADISSAIVGTDGETQYLDGTENYYTAALDGWISMCIGGFTQSNELWITVYDDRNETWGTSAESTTTARNTLFIIFPIRANQRMRFRMRCTSVTYARFYPCEGNV